MQYLRVQQYYTDLYDLHTIKQCLDQFKRLNDVGKLRSTTFTLRGNEYQVVSWFHGSLDLIYEDTPMLNFIYKTMTENFKSYFEGSI